MATYIKNEPEVETEDFFKEKQDVPTEATTAEPTSSDDDGFPSYGYDEPLVAEEQQDSDIGEGEIAEGVPPREDDASACDIDPPVAIDVRKVDTNLDGKGEFPYKAYNTSKLHSLIYEKKWDEASERISQHEYVLPKENNTNLPQVSEIGFVDDMGRLPLHCALQFPDAPLHLISKLLRNGGRSFAEERHQGSNDLPLHIACSVAANQGLKIMLLLNAYPVAVWAESGDGKSTPLCLLMEHHPDLNLVRTLVEHAEKNQLQLDASIFTTADSEGQVPLHIAIQHYASTEVILYLMEECSESIYAKRKDGLLPLHVAAQQGCTKEVLECLLQEHAAGVEKKANKAAQENTPLHLLFHPEDNIVAWLSHVHDEDAPDDLLQPYKMAKVMLKEYYKHFKNTFGQSQGHRKRKRTGPERMALDKVKQVLKKKNTVKLTVMDNAKQCLGILGNSDDLEAIVSYMQEILKGKNVFEREDA